MRAACHVQDPVSPSGLRLSGWSTRREVPPGCDVNGLAVNFPLARRCRRGLDGSGLRIVGERERG